MMRSFFQWLSQTRSGAVTGLAVLFVLALAMRLVVLHANQAAHEGVMPFTLESALQYRMTEQIYTGAGIPRHEPMVQYPEGVEPFRTYTIGAEYLYAGLARLMPDAVPLPTRIRWASVLLFCLGIPCMAWWVAVMTRSRAAGGIAGFFYAVMLSSVIRSAGLELSRENLALPLLLLHLAFDAVARRQERAGRFHLAALGSAATLGLALATWDMIQFYAVFWALFGLAAYVRQADHTLTRGFTLWLWQAAALVLTAMLSPYHREHGLLFSPALLLAYGVGVSIALDYWQQRRGQERLCAGWRFVVAVFPWLLVTAFSSLFAENYTHFSELLWAKLRFLNVKPDDPALLTFAQRILWVPALDSATWRLTFSLFPLSLLLSIVGLTVIGLVSWIQRTPYRAWAAGIETRFIFLFVISLCAFVLFVRFHVYVALFMAAWLGGCWAWAQQRNAIWRLIVGLGLAVAATVEAAQVLQDPGRWGRPNVYAAELEGLTAWLADQAAPQPVLANFGVSGSVLTYGGCAIVLHPKFEKPAIRDRVEAYGRALFTGTERGFRDWAEAHGAAYYVHGVGEFAQRRPEWQMRYFVNALEPPTDAAARVFEFAPEQVRFFEYVWGNRKYRVFRVISSADEASASRLASLAEDALAAAQWAEAEEYAWAALALFPGSTRAQQVVHQVALARQATDE
jgi:hypothetical protein